MIRLKIHRCITSIYFNPGPAEQILNRGPKISKYLVILLSIYIFKKSQLGSAAAAIHNMSKGVMG